MSRAIYVYCVVRSWRKPRLAAVPAGLPGAERPLALKLEDGLWLISASVPLDRYGNESLEASLRDLDWVATVALAHEAVVEYFVRSPGTAVIPLKLFTMFSSQERAEAEMRRRQRELERVFERIDGCEEWGVRVTPGMVPRGPRARRRPATGAGFLAARKQARDAARQASSQMADAADVAFQSLSEIAREGVRRTEDQAGVPAPLVEAAFLVPVRRRARFHAAAQRLAREVARSGGQLTLSGPWPPYHFVGLAAREESA